MEELRVTTDSHLFEPPDLWAQRLPEATTQALFAGLPRYHQPDTIKNAMAAEPAPDEPFFNGRTRAQIMRGHDPELRIKDNEADGVWGQVIFPTMSLLTWMLGDQKLADAMGKTYNDWLAETHVPFDQLVCGAILPSIGDTDHNVPEIERAANMGMRTVILPVTPPAGMPQYFDRAWDCVWAASLDHQLPISFHAGGSGSEWEYEETFGHPHGVFYDMFGKMRTAVPTFRLVADLCSGGVLDRFPELHVVIVESGAGWLGWLMQEMDSFSEFAPGYDTLGLSLRPSEYVRRQVHCTFMNDRPALELIDYTGHECLLWGNDYPHREGTWPESDAALDTQFAGVPDGVRAAIVGGTAAKLYNLEPPR
jgi:predicted TIM-barrel fold metal-dependent hydrolase